MHLSPRQLSEVNKSALLAIADSTDTRLSATFRDRRHRHALQLINILRTNAQHADADFLAHLLDETTERDRLA